MLIISCELNLSRCYHYLLLLIITLTDNIFCCDNLRSSKIKVSFLLELLHIILLKRHHKSLAFLALLIHNINSTICMEHSRPFPLDLKHNLRKKGNVYSFLTKGLGELIYFF